VSFYRQLDTAVFESTSATTSPWDPSLQHGGPPSALLVRVIEHALPRPDLLIARVSIDFFGGIPQGVLTASARVLRPGRRIELVEATLSHDERTVAVARAWRMRPSPDAVPASAIEPRPARPDSQAQNYFDGFDPEWGYGRAIEWRFASGGFGELGPAKVWTRVMLPVVAGEVASGLQRMLLVADSINGLSAELDLREWLFVPPGLAVTAQRVDAGEWILIEAETSIDAGGLGVARGILSDDHGPLALVSQPLLVQRRER
jgi:hypothetical protein